MSIAQKLKEEGKINKYEIIISYDENDNDYVSCVKGYDKISCIIALEMQENRH